ncbi:MAG: NHLP bacteriocin system secretion protein [Cyanobacteriota bacterium]|nr:NHLP bacteriocin system secretion protein [Cyanobacteriota bacterium]
MSLFRKNALDALSSPEQLDQPLELLRPSYWLLLISLLGFSLSILLWSIFGRLPVRIEGRGILVRTENLQWIQSEINGRIKEFKVNVGDCIKQATPLAIIDPVQLELEQQKANNQLEILIANDASLDLIAIQREDELRKSTARWKLAFQKNAVSQVEWDQRVQQLSELLYNLETSNNQREQLINQKQSEIVALEQQIARTATVKAPQAGCVTDRHVQLGQVVQPGVTLFELERDKDANTLESLAFFPAKDGKRLRIGQPVRVTPTTTKAQRHGGIEAEILKVRRLPVSKEAVINRLYNKESLFKAINTKDEGPLIEVTTSLAKDPTTPSGYDWGGSKGPDLQLTAGTPTTLRVLVEQRRPISYVIPLLRNLSGIY